MMHKTMTGALGAFLSLYAWSQAAAAGDQIRHGDIDDLVRNFERQVSRSAATWSTD